MGGATCKTIHGRRKPSTEYGGEGGIGVQLTQEISVDIGKS